MVCRLEPLLDRSLRRVIVHAASPRHLSFCLPLGLRKLSHSECTETCRSCQHARYASDRRRYRLLASDQFPCRTCGVNMPSRRPAPDPVLKSLRTAID